MLISDGAVEVTADGWRINAARLGAIRIPHSLVGVLQARLDRLLPAEKLALQQAAVIGTVFWDQALEALNAGSTQVLSALVSRNLAIPVLHAALEGQREYAFKNQLLQQVTYDTVLKSAQRAYHAHAARWLAERSGEGAKEFFGINRWKAPC
jgi:predicted ATPase